MSDISSISGSSSTPIQGIGARRGTSAAAGASGGASGGDSVEVSQTAQLLAKLSELPEIRIDLVDRIKSEIATGTYDATGEKFEQALENLLSDLAEA